MTFVSGFAGWHHAYVIEGEESLVLPKLEDFFVSDGIMLRGNPDYHVTLSEQFLIDDANKLIADAHLRSVGEKKIFIHSFGFITHEAQNALLKLFEEPPQGTHFFLIVPTVSLLLPTVRSRMQVIKASKDIEANETALSKQVQTFLNANKADRMVLVKDIAADRSRAALFFDALEHALVKRTKSTETLEALYQAKNYIRDRGASPKILLEYLALMV
jgi:DNA polymerase III delta prime subunit